MSKKQLPVPGDIIVRMKTAPKVQQGYLSLDPDDFREHQLDAHRDVRPFTVLAAVNAEWNSFMKTGKSIAVLVSTSRGLLWVDSLHFRLAK